MRKIWTVVAALVLGLALGSEAQAECSAQYVLNNIGGVWKVNNAGGRGFGGVFTGKPQVAIEVVGPLQVAVDGTGPFGISGRSFAPEGNPNGGVWCSFILDGTPARIGYASNRWWILELGEYRDRRKIELIRR